MLYTVPNKQTWNSILHNSNLGVRGPRYTRKFLEPKNRVNRGKGVTITILQILVSLYFVSIFLSIEGLFGKILQ